MSSIKSRIAYLRGFMDGLGINADNKESKVMLEVVNILDEMADKVEDIEDSQAQYEEYLDAINDDLNGIEEFYDEYDESDCDLDDFIELECPECSETVYVEEDMIETHECIKCPNCQSNILNSTTKIEDENND
jgi:DNA-directed RNA polymerase subunit RPC12/RpoP